MGRRRSHSKLMQSTGTQHKNKEKKQGKKMHQPLLGVTHVVPAGPVIKDEVSSKHFGILLSTQQSVEEFQLKSAMRKAFTTEYQYHYWALVARVNIGDEILDIAIPTVLFNYRQEVSGAAVSFHLNDVEAASNATAEIAGIYANVLAGSSFAQYLSERFGSIEWMNVPMNTCHVHPGMMSTFSGTDYAKTINDPGICFPLSEPQSQPSFSSIICHDTAKKNIAKIVRTEYRFANRDGNTISYKHGQCVSYWKGYEGKTKEVTYSPFQALFKNKTNELVYEVEPYPSYVTTDGANIVLKDNELMAEIFAKFDELEFSPNTDNIKSENITAHVRTYYGGGTYCSGNTKSLNSTVGNSTQAPSIQYMENICIAAGYDSAVVKKWTWKQLNDFYKTVCDVNELQKKKPVKDVPDEIQAIYAERARVDKLFYNEKKAYLVTKQAATMEDLALITPAELNIRIEDYFDEIEEEAEMKILREAKASLTTDGESPDDDEDVQELILSLPLDEKCRFLFSFGISYDEIKGMNEAKINGMILSLVREFDTGHPSDDNQVIEELKDIIDDINKDSAAKTVFVGNSDENSDDNNEGSAARLSAAGTSLPADPKNNKSIRNFLIQCGVAEEVFETLGNDEIYALLEEFNW